MIVRDSNTTSLWQDNANTFTPALISDDRTYDVVIIGAGITGIATGLMLQQAGKNCIIFDSHNIGFGTTGGTTAHLNTLLDTSYVELIRKFGKETTIEVAKACRDALNLVASQVSKYHISCGYKETSAYVFSNDKTQSHELTELHVACGEAGVETAFVKSFPLHLPVDKVMMVPRQAKFSPLDYVYGLAKVYEQAGGVFRFNCRVENVSGDEDLHVETQDGNFIASSVIYATHIPPGRSILHMRCVPYRSYAMAMELQGKSHPEGLFYDMENPYHYYRTQEVGDKTLFIAGGCDHKTAHEPNTMASFHKLESHVRERFKVARVTHQWSSQYYESVDGLPYIGHFPGHADNVYVATGFGGNGMTYSHIAARVLSHLILKVPCHYAGVFHPSRIKPAAGFSNFVTHTADMVRQFAHKWSPLEEITEVSSIAPGEGRIVKYHDESVAIYRDKGGVVHAISPLCAHMGCSVTWNSAEESWDCPCHGARYSVDGEVLNGPAARALEKLDLREAEPLDHA